MSNKSPVRGRNEDSMCTTPRLLPFRWNLRDSDRSYRALGAGVSKLSSDWLEEFDNGPAGTMIRQRHAGAYRTSTASFACLLDCVHRWISGSSRSICIEKLHLAKLVAS